MTSDRNKFRGPEHTREANVCMSGRYIQTSKVDEGKKKKKIRVDLKIGLDFKCVSCGKQSKKTILVWNEEMGIWRERSL